MTGIYRPDLELMNAYALLLERSARALAVCRRINDLVPTDELDELEQAIVHAQDLRHRHLEACIEQASEDLKREAAVWKSGTG